MHSLMHSRLGICCWEVSDGVVANSGRWDSTGKLLVFLLDAPVWWLHGQGCVCGNRLWSS